MSLRGAPVVEMPGVKTRDPWLGLGPCEVGFELFGDVSILEGEGKVGEVGACEDPGDEKHLLVGVELGEEDVVVHRFCLDYLWVCSG